MYRVSRRRVRFLMQHSVFIFRALVPSGSLVLPGRCVSDMRGAMAVVDGYALRFCVIIIRVYYC